MVPSLKRNPPLDLAQLRQILAPVIELGRTRIGVIRHVLGRFQRAAVTEKYRDSRAPKRVIAECLRQSRRDAARFHDTEHVAPGDGLAG